MKIKILLNLFTLSGIGTLRVNKSSPNHHSDVPMFVRRKKQKTKKNNNKKTRADPCAFKAFQQSQKVLMESSVHIKCVRYTLYINMLTFVSLVVSQRLFDLSKTISADS